MIRDYMKAGEKMPRFSDQEKEIINQKLLIEGERLFATLGLKKVTVDDLVASVNISKGSFYAFYSSKEHLYIEINFRLQDRLYLEIKEAVSKMQFPSAKALTKEVIMRGLNGLTSSPILSQFDLSIMDYLQRKLPKEIFDNHVGSDMRFLEMLEERGVKFKLPYSVIVKALYSVLFCLDQYKSDEDFSLILNLLIEGIVEQSVE